jgi:hypothetical protein
MGQPLSTRNTVTSKTGAKLVIQNPKNDGGYITNLINISDLLAGVGEQPIKVSGKTGDFNIPIDANSMVTNIYITIYSGTPTVQVGTTDMGTDIQKSILITDDLPIDTLTKFSTAGALYFYVTGGYVSVRVDLKTNFI